MQLLVLYVIIAVGFFALWITWRSSQNIRRLRENVGQVLRHQRGKAFEPNDEAKLYGMF